MRYFSQSNVIPGDKLYNYIYNLQLDYERENKINLTSKNANTDKFMKLSFRYGHVESIIHICRQNYYSKSKTYRLILAVVDSDTKYLNDNLKKSLNETHSQFIYFLALTNNVEYLKKYLQANSWFNNKMNLNTLSYKVEISKQIMEGALQNRNFTTIKCYLEAFHEDKTELKIHLSAIKILFYDVEMLLYIINNVENFDISDYEEFIYLDYMRKYIEYIKTR